MDYYGAMVHIFRLRALALACMLTVGAVPALLAQPAAPTEVLPAAPPEAEDTDHPLEDQDTALTAELFYELLLSEMSTSGGDASTGYALMLDAARKSSDPRLYRRAAEMALQSRSAEAALLAIRSWNAAFPQSREANRYLLYILVTLNRTNESAEPLQRELAMASGRSKLASVRALPQLYARVSNKATAARIVEQALAGELRHPAIGPAAWATIGRMRLAAQDKAGALEAASQSLALDHTDDGAAMLALQLLDEGVAEAEVLLPPYFADTPMPEVRMAYARLLLESQRLADAQAQVDAVTRERPDAAEAWLLQASLKLQSGQLDAAEQALAQFTRQLDSAPPGEMRSRAFTQAWLMHAQIAEKRGDYAGAETWLARIDNAPELLAAQSRRASLLARQGKLSQARAVIRATPARQPEDERLKLQAEAQLLREAGEYREAYEIQGRAAALAPEDDDLIYDQAMLAEKAGQPREAERLLRSIVERKPDHRHALNALGYMLADRGEKLAEARSLIARALEQAPGDPFITDSLGWVEFRLGNHARAEELLQSAFDTQPDAEIAAHLGEVLWMRGQRERALQVWREGLRINKNHDTLQETIKRLGARP
ncbi:tetratricopeptide repeat protein [Melaminivora sp.]|uniref:tetratricopeptide repeat protein n=1 Tax=Melaminivora sp. TaxID=1933032 RepID=UPI0028A7B1E1|nr:tetratricopeptide repeat protein [Melaminivora sp.]